MQELQLPPAPKASMLTLQIFHADHGIQASHRDVIISLFAEAGEGFLLKTVELPNGCAPLMSGIHGPIAGDAPVPSAEVRWATRGSRKGLSRLCDRAPRSTTRPRRPARNHRRLPALRRRGGGCPVLGNPRAQRGVAGVQVGSAFWADPTCTRGACLVGTLDAPTPREYRSDMVILSQH